MSAVIIAVNVLVVVLLVIVLRIVLRRSARGVESTCEYDAKLNDLIIGRQKQDEAISKLVGEIGLLRKKLDDNIGVHWGVIQDLKKRVDELESKIVSSNNDATEVVVPRKTIDEIVSPYENNTSKDVPNNGLIDERGSSDNVKDDTAIRDAILKIRDAIIYHCKRRNDMVGTLSRLLMAPGERYEKNIEERISTYLNSRIVCDRYENRYAVYIATQWDADIKRQIIEDAINCVCDQYRRRHFGLISEGVDYSGDESPSRMVCDVYGFRLSMNDPKWLVDTFAGEKQELCGKIGKESLVALEESLESLGKLPHPEAYFLKVVDKRIVYNMHGSKSRYPSSNLQFESEDDAWLCLRYLSKVWPNEGTAHNVAIHFGENRVHE